jgi:tetratricopeptide (TPR) repeat protein
MLHRSKAVSALGLSAVVCAAAAGCLRNPEAKAARLMDHGDKYVAVGRYDAAVIDYRNAIKAAPGSVEPYLKLADAQALLGETADAYQTFTKASDLAPDDARPRVGAGRMLLSAGKAKEAAVRAQAALSRDPSLVDATILYGSALVRQEKWTDAEPLLRDAVQRDPESVQAHVALADLLLQTGREPEAEQTLSRAHGSHPQDELANRALAAFYLSKGRDGEAEPLLVTAAAVRAQRYRSSLALADFYLAAGRAADARVALDQAPKESGVSKAVKARMEALSVY